MDTSRLLRRVGLATVVVLAAGGLIVYGGCCHGLLCALAGGYERAVGSGRQAIPSAAEFDRLYPGGQHFISYYTGDYGPTTWNSKVGVHGRYVLSVQCPITLDPVTRSLVVRYGSPTFVLTEVVHVEHRANGQTAVRYGESWTFGAEELGRVVAADGDLGVLGIALKAHEPVADFDIAVR